MEGTSAERRYAASAAWLGMTPPPPCEFYGGPDDEALDCDIDALLLDLYGPARVAETVVVEDRRAA